VGRDGRGITKEAMGGKMASYIRMEFSPKGGRCMGEEMRILGRLLFLQNSGTGIERRRHNNRGRKGKSGM